MKKNKSIALIVLVLMRNLFVSAQEPPRIEILNEDCIEKAFKNVFNTKQEYDSASACSFTLTALISIDGRLKNFEIHQCDSLSIVFKKREQYFLYLTNCLRIRVPGPIKKRITVKKQKLYIEMLISRGSLYDFEDIPFTRQDSSARR